MRAAIDLLPMLNSLLMAHMTAQSAQAEQGVVTEDVVKGLHGDDLYF